MTPAARRNTREHLPCLDGLRGLACLMVLAAHLSTTAPGGFLGVDVFFVLSGFLITRLLLDEWEQQDSINLKNFYLRRALRILPAMILWFAAIGAFAATFLSAHEFYDVCRAALLTLCAQANRSDLWGDVPLSVFSHAWSLSVEDKFYFAWPLALCALLGQKGVSRRAIIGLLLLGVASCAAVRARIFFVSTVPAFSFVYRDLICRADSLLLGCLGGAFSVWNLVPRARWFQILLKLASLVTLGALTFLMFGLTHRATFLYYGGFTLIAVGVTSLILTVVHSRPRVLCWILECRALTWTGRISFGLYLWHIPLMTYGVTIHPRLTGGADFMGGPLSPAFRPSIIAMTYLAAACSYYCVERPFLKLKPKYGPPISLDPILTFKPHTIQIAEGWKKSA